MKKTFRAVFVFVVLLTATLSAQNMCVDLCTQCVGKKKDQTCKKVEEHCQCAALLDSINTAQTAKEAKLSESQNRLSQELQNICDQKFCISKISFEDGIFKKISLDNNPTAQEAAKSIYETKVSSDQSSMTRIEPLPPLNEECSKFCGDCPVTAKMLKSKKPKFKDKFCKKIEESCKCIDYAINAKQLEEQSKADSAAEFESKIKRIENANSLAKQLHAQCDNSENCILSVSIANKEMDVLSVQKIKEPIKVEPKKTIEPIDEKPVASLAEEKTNEKIATSHNQSAANSSKALSFGANFHEVDPSETSSSYKAPNVQKSRSFYFGLTFAYESLLTEEFYAYSQFLDYDSGINFGFFFKNYINRCISFSFGLNAVIHFGTYDNYYLDYDSYFYDSRTYNSLDYTKLMAEIPFEFRFGFPIGSVPIKPFASVSIHIRKLIYQWTKIDTSFYYDEWGNAAAITDWELVSFIGAGIELSRHFSFEFQWVLGNFYTNDSDFDLAYRLGDTWRFKIDVAF